MRVKCPDTNEVEMVLERDTGIVELGRRVLWYTCDGCDRLIGNSGFGIEDEEHVETTAEG